MYTHNAQLGESTLCLSVFGNNMKSILNNEISFLFIGGGSQIDSTCGPIFIFILSFLQENV